MAENLILPSLALGIAYMALIARITRASMLEVLAQDYIRTANSKGLATSRVLLLHALKNASVPIVTVIGIGIALLISGVVITETVFNIPGLGRLTVDAVLKRDYPIVQGLIIVFAGAKVLVNSLIDISYVVPRSAHPVLTLVTISATADDLPRPASPMARLAMFIRRNPTIALGALLLAAPRGDRACRAADRRRPVPAGADQPAAPALRALLVRHRPVRPRRVLPHRLRRARVADRRLRRWRRCRA